MVRPHQYNLFLAMSLMVVAALAPETLQGRVSQLVVTAMGCFAAFQAGVTRQADFDAVKSQFERHSVWYPLVVGVLWLTFFVTAEDTGFEIICGAIIITCVFLAGGIWQRNRINEEANR